MYKGVLFFGFVLLAFCAHLYSSQNITVSCPSCSQYSFTFNNVTFGTTTCPTGTFCNSSVSSYSTPCSPSYSCNSYYANSTTNYSCNTTGRVPYPSNCRQYYYCFTNGTAFSTMIMTCPGLSYYDSATGKCTVRTGRVCGNITYIPTVTTG